MTELPVHHSESFLAGRSVMLVGKLASMSRRDAETLIEEHGGRLVDRVADEVDVILLADETADAKRLIAGEQVDDRLRERVASGDVELVRESELWARLGLVDAHHGIERLYTAAMLADLVRVPVAAIRQWNRSGALHSVREVRRLAYFDFEEVGVARKLAQLIHAGCSLSTINRRLNSFSRLLPDVPRPLADPAVVVEGRRLFIRRGEGLAEPSGQLLIDFDASKPDSAEAGPVAIPFVAQDPLRRSADRSRGSHPKATEDLRALAAELDASGQHAQAADAYRAILFSGEATAEDHFALAELLYLAGDLSAARERYYLAIELDEDFVEARSNLGCVLAEEGELGLAEAAFRGALEYHPDYADAHYHLARLFDRANRSNEALRHWQLFMSLAPASPWADEARERIEGEGSRLSAFGFRRDSGDAPGGLADSR